MSQAEISGYLAPPAESIARVETALKALGIMNSTYSAVRDKLTVTTTVAVASDVIPLVVDRRHVDNKLPYAV